MVRQQQTLLTQIVDGMHQMQQVLRIVQVGRVPAALVQDLRQHARTHAFLTAPQVNQHHAAVNASLQLRREIASHIVQSNKCGDDQADRRGDFLLLTRIAPAGSHGQAVFAHRNRNTQSGTQFKPHRLDGVVQGGVLAHFTASGHPVG